MLENISSICFCKVWPGMPKVAHNCMKSSEVTLELQFCWKYKMKNKFKKRTSMQFNLQFITANCLVQLDFRIY